MAPLGKGFTDRQAEQLVGRILQIGVLLSALVVSAGGLLYLSQNADKPAGHHDFTASPSGCGTPRKSASRPSAWIPGP